MKITYVIKVPYFPRISELKYGAPYFQETFGMRLLWTVITGFSLCAMKQVCLKEMDCFHTSTTALNGSKGWIENANCCHNLEGT